MWKSSIAFTRFSKTPESHGLGTVPPMVNKAKGSLSSGIYSLGGSKTNEQLQYKDVFSAWGSTAWEHRRTTCTRLGAGFHLRLRLLNWGLQSEKEVEFGLVKKRLGKRGDLSRRMSVPGLCLCEDRESRDTSAIHKLKRVCMVQA